MNIYEQIPHSSKIKGVKIPHDAYESPADWDKSEFLRRINDFGSKNPDFKSSIKEIKGTLTSLRPEDIEAFSKTFSEDWETDMDSGFKEFCNQIEKHVHGIDPYDVDKKRKDKRTILKEALLNYLCVKGLSEKRKLKYKSIN